MSGSRELGARAAALAQELAEEERVLEAAGDVVLARGVPGLARRVQGELVPAVAAFRRACVAEAVEVHGVAETARLLGLSRARVYALCQQHRAAS